MYLPDANPADIQTLLAATGSAETPKRDTISEIIMVELNLANHHYFAWKTKFDRDITDVHFFPAKTSNYLKIEL